MTTHPIVRVSHVSRYFKRGSERVNVLNDLDLEVPEGQFLALMGPSGSGKTTLLNLIAGLDTPSEGEVWVGDRCVSKMNEAQLARWRNEHVGFVFQFYHLLPVLSAYENVELPLLLLPLSSKKRREQVMTALDLVGLNDHVAARLHRDRAAKICHWIARAPTHAVIPATWLPLLGDIFELAPVASFDDLVYTQVEPHHPMRVVVVAIGAPRPDRRCPLGS